MNKEFLDALDLLAAEKGISADLLYQAIEDALISGYTKNKKNAGFNGQNVKVDLNRETGVAKVYEERIVSEAVENPAEQISLADARLISPDCELGQMVRVEVTPADFGRIAAQNAKNVVVQRIREAERDMILEKFKERVGDLVTGIVKRVEANMVLIDLDKTEATLTKAEWVPGEVYRINDHIKVYIAEVSAETRGPNIKVSRKSPDLVKRLFEMEVPEIASGDVLIKNISREAGSRTKMSVWSYDDNIDPIGSCVGQRGVRVQQVVKELNGEKIDIIKWDPDPAIYIKSALSPATILEVKINEADHAATVIVPDLQLSLAIGKVGQNARLAARLTGWKIDIKSESQYANLRSDDNPAAEEFPIDVEALKEIMLDVMKEEE